MSDETLANNCLFSLHDISMVLLNHPNTVFYLCQDFTIIDIIIIIIIASSTNFKCGLGLERGPSNLVRTIGYLLDWEVADLINKVDINRLDGA